MKNYEILKEQIVNLQKNNKKNKPIMFMMIGIPASGKSTIVEQLKNDFDLPILSMDTISEEYASENNIPYSVAASTCFGEIKKLFKERKKTIQTNKTGFIWDQMNTNVNYRKARVSEFKKTHFVIGICMNPENDDVVNRMIHRKMHTDKVLSMQMVSDLARELNQPELSENFEEIFFVGKDNSIALSQNPDFKMNKITLSKDIIDNKLKEMGIFEEYYKLYDERRKGFIKIKEDIRERKNKIV